MRYTDHSRYHYVVKEYASLYPLALRGRVGEYFVRNSGTALGGIIDDRIFLNPGYASNGCSWSPNTKRSTPGCIWHDMLEQVRSLYPEAITEAETAAILLEIHTADECRWAKAAHFALTSKITAPLRWLYRTINK